VRESDAIGAFMQRLDLGVIIDEKDFAMAKRKDPGTYQQSVEVVARGKTFRALAAHPKGGGFVKCDGKTCGVYREELRNTDEELIRKFTHNVADLLPLDKTRQVAEGILALEKLENTAALAALVVSEGGEMF